MKGLFVGIGLCMLGVGSVLAGIGHYDGVLGVDDPAEFFDHDGSATFRVVVTGTVEDASNSFSLYREELVIPDTMRDDIDTRQFVPVDIVSDERRSGFMEVWQFVPEPGQTLVVSGTVRTEWALFDAGSHPLASLPVLFVHPTEYHAPLIFKG
jgi:hypothetical protein